MTPKWLRSQRRARETLLSSVNAVRVKPDDVLVIRTHRTVNNAQDAAVFKARVANVLSNLAREAS